MRVTEDIAGDQSQGVDATVASLDAPDVVIDAPETSDILVHDAAKATFGGEFKVIIVHS